MQSSTSELIARGNDGEENRVLLFQNALLVDYWQGGREGDRYSEEKEREREAVAESITAFFFS